MEPQNYVEFNHTSNPNSHFTNSNGFDDPLQQRRSANYQPNVWKYDFLQSLSSDYNELEDQYKKRVEELTKEARQMLVDTKDILAKLQLVDSIEKLGLAGNFEEEIKGALETISSSFKHYSLYVGDLYATSLSFRLLRQHGFQVNQDMFGEFLDETGSFVGSKIISQGTMGVLELFEASHLACEGEQILEEAKAFAGRVLKSTCSSAEDRNLAKRVAHALELPYHWRVKWFDVKWQVNASEEAAATLKPIIELAKLNFNVVQATLRKDLRELSRWWKNLGLTEKLDFARDRLVECFLCAVGVAFEPKHSHLRICLTKAITLILILDDVYDVFGSLEELRCFTNAMNRWDPKELEGLPACLTTCFEAVRVVVNEIAHGMQKEKGWGLLLVQPQLEKGWAEFCEALFEEAKWYHQGYIPSLEEYLANGWVSSGGIVLSIHILLSITSDRMLLFEQNHELLHNISLIIRLCNDLGTSQAEQERGDAASSIVCYMEEANVEEQVARKHINAMIDRAWKRINSAIFTPLSSDEDPTLRLLAHHNTNMARVVHNLYQNGDKFRDQDTDNRKQFLSLLVKPFNLE